jgi:ATP-dependent DNA helicase RecG
MKEQQNIEWKQSWRDDYLRWICGFANAEGGTLVIGKNDRGEVVGVANAARLLEDIPNKVRDILGIVVAVNLHSQDGLDWLDIVVDAYPSPVSYKGEYHLRSGSTKQELRGAALDRFLLRKLGRHWDGVPVPHLAVNDLDARAIQAFRKLAARSGRLSAESLAESDAELVEKLHLTEGRYLKRAATLLFHADPEKFTTGACAKIGFFRTDSDLLYQDVIEGDLFTQVNKRNAGQLPPEGSLARLWPSSHRSRPTRTLPVPCSWPARSNPGAEAST